MAVHLKRARPPFPHGWCSLPISPTNLTLANTLPVGQSFLWHRHAVAESGSGVTEEFSRAVDSPPRVVCLRQSPTQIYYTAIPATPAAQTSTLAEDTRLWLEDYFQLAQFPDLTTLYRTWAERDPALFGKAELQATAIGVRVLRQDPWECLIAFITSTNNHVPRITSLLHKLCTTFSPPVLSLDNPDGHGETTYHLFPRAEDIPLDNLESLLRQLGFGYRAAFIASTLKTLRAFENVDEELARWRAAPLEETRERLLELKGVGRKVADCVQLMCMDQLSLVPIDTHLHAVAMRHPAFPSRLKSKRTSKAAYDDVQSFLADCWGPLAGWAQAVMFAKAVQSGPSPKAAVSSRGSLELQQDGKHLTKSIKRSSEYIKVEDAALDAVKVEVVTHEEIKLEAVELPEVKHEDGVSKRTRRATRDARGKR